MVNYLVILELTKSLSRSKIQISDFLTLRLGWWRPRFLIIDSNISVEKHDNEIELWINSRGKNTRIDYLHCQSEKLMEHFGSQNSNTNPLIIIYVKPGYVPLVTMDEFWISTTNAFLKNGLKLATIAYETNNRNEVVGYMLNNNDLLDVLNNNFTKFKQQLVMESVHHKHLSISSEYFAKI